MDFSIGLTLIPDSKRHWSAIGKLVIIDDKHYIEICEEDYRHCVEAISFNKDLAKELENG